MRTWKAILLGSIVGLGACACFLWPALLSKPELLLSLQQKWPELSLVWLSGYGLTVVVCCVAYVLGTGRRGWMGTYVLELSRAQYWTAALLLLVLDVAHSPLAPDAALPRILLVRPAVTACAGLILIGAMGFLIAGLGLAVTERQQKSSRDVNLEASLREMLALWQEQTSIATARSSSAEAWRASMQAALDALVRETGRLKDEMRAAVEELRTAKASGLPAQAEPTEVAMLHDAMRSIEQSVPRLEQVANSLSAAVSELQYSVPPSTGAIAELDELLRDVSETGQMPV